MEHLFGSKTRTKLLNLFMSNPNRPFYVREITRKVEEQINSVRRELANLLSLGIITSDSTNNKLYYEVDQHSQYYRPLRELFTGKREGKKSEKVSKIAEPNEEVKAPITMADDDIKLWEKAGNISGLLYSGEFTREKNSPVDVLIIGDVPTARAEAAIVELEKQKGKELRYAVIEPEEWKYRQQVNDKFWSQITNAKNQILIDNNDLFVKK